MGKHQQRSAELPRRQSIVLALYMAPANHQSKKRSDIYAERLDDEPCYAVGSPSSSAARRIHNVPYGGSRRGIEGSPTDVGSLQYCSAKVSILHTDAYTRRERGRKKIANNTQRGHWIRTTSQHNLRLGFGAGFSQSSRLSVARRIESEAAHREVL